MAATQVLVITGPIASGTSSTAQLVAARARAPGRSAAVVDLDRVYMMLDDTPLMSSEITSRQARHAAAALTNQFIADGIDLVIVEGASGRWSNASSSYHDLLLAARRSLSR